METNITQRQSNQEPMSRRINGDVTPFVDFQRKSRVEIEELGQKKKQTKKHL